MAKYIVSVAKKEDAEELERLYCTQELIHCKDCQYYEERYSWCNRYLNMHLDTYEDGYCAWAEPKDE